jgi:hypothetical protein
MKTPSKSSHDSCTAAQHFGTPLHSPSSERRRHMRPRQASHDNSPYHYHEETSRRNHHNTLSLRRLIVPVSLIGLFLVYSVILNYTFTVNMMLIHQQGLPVSDRPLSFRTDAYYHHHEQGQSQSGLLVGGKHQNRSGDDDKKGTIIHPLNTAVDDLRESKNLMCSSCQAALTLSCRSDQALLDKSNSDLPATRPSPLSSSLHQWILKAEYIGKAVWNVTLDCSSCRLGALDCPKVQKNGATSPSSTAALRKTDILSSSTLPKTDTSSTSTLPKTDTKTVSPTTADMTATDTTSSIIDLEKAAPTIRYGVTHSLASVPTQNRLPVKALANLTAYFADRQHVYPAAEYFFEYNPSIVRLPASYQQQWNQQGSRSDADTPLYLASYRVTNTQQCVTDELELTMIGGSWPRPASKNWLGLALLNANLEIVWDFVTDLGTQIQRLRVEDYRLFALHDQIYVTTFQLVFPIWLGFANTDSSDNNKRPCDDCKALTPMDGANSSRSSTPNVTVWIRKWPSCSADMKTRRTGKNLNYFVDGHNRTILEKYPMGSKELFKLDVPCRSKELLEGALNITHNPRVPEPSIATAPRNHALYKVLSNERGSACCVEIPDARPSQHTGNASIAAPLLLGVSHSKTRFRQYTQREHGNLRANHFFSSFYAMESTEPYTVVARSGQFCLGFAPAQETDRGQNPYAHMNQSPLIVDKAYASCPRIHFVSGVVEKADDPTQVIVAYGINDCIPRMVQVAKVDISRMLFQATGTTD